MINGVLNVYKEKDYTSFDVVAKLRGILKQKKIGHTGTLDPMATGVLIVCLGNATKLVDMITANDKCYEAQMLLGVSTDTEDITGTVLKETEVRLDKDEVLSTVLSFVGEYDQIPPMYSAIKKDGKKLYEYARKGITVEREPRKVNIFSISDIKINIPYIDFKVHCSKGTYIRSLCRDIGDKLSVGGTLTKLNRANVNDFYEKDSLTLDQISKLQENGELIEKILPTDSLLTMYKAHELDEQYEKFLLNGNILYKSQFKDEIDSSNEEIIRVYLKEKFIALYKLDDEMKAYKPYKMFFE